MSRRGEHGRGSSLKLSNGTAYEAVGRARGESMFRPPCRPSKRARGSVIGEVVHRSCSLSIGLHGIANNTDRGKSGSVL